MSGGVDPSSTAKLTTGQVALDSTMKKKIYVGMSGGVDSSVSAALLKEAGHEVTGVFIKTWHPDFLTCDWREERRDAMDVCAKLGIPFTTLDLEAEYKREVADYMINEYRKGRTPNPDVMCNRHIKFGVFFNWSRTEGADMIATGHYARTEDEALLVGVDKNKDQSYFLWAIEKDVLKHTLFPVGDLTKPRVRELAEKYNLPVATKKDSQGVCFLGKVEMKAFLKKFIEVSPGAVVNEDGAVVGSHDGALLYTLGERHGFTVTKKKPTDGPYYVVAKDLDKNTLTVSQSKQGDTNSRGVAGVVLEDTNWLAVPEEGDYLCRFRYRQDLFPCVVEQENRIRFSDPQASVAVGQSLVLYKGDQVIGGGIIQSTY